MLPRLALLALGKFVGFPSRIKLWQFAGACQNPKLMQEVLLREILAKHADTDFGRDHGFSKIQTFADFRKQVPLAPYEYFEPYLARVRRGELNALLSDDRVLMFALTSGTTAARKTIPVTPRFLADYRRGWDRWGLRMLLDHQSVSCSPILQLAGDPAEFYTEAGIPCGSLSGLTVEMQKRFVRFLYVMPAAANPIRSTADKYYVALRMGLPRPVGVITAANPSTLVGLARTLEARADELLRDIADGTLTNNLEISPAVRANLMPYLRRSKRRAKALTEAASRDGVLRPFHAWPSHRLLIGTWMGGSVGPYLRQVRRYYGETYLRDLGLIASEGRMTIPLCDDSPAGVLDVATHYFEFIPESEFGSDRPIILGVDEVEEGNNYFLVPTTAAGLYRYDIRDLVRVTGFYGRTPTLEFLNKGTHFASLTGEKLSEYQVTRAVATVTHRLGLPLPVYALAPVWDESCPYYGVFIEADVWHTSEHERVLGEVDAALSANNSEYASKRASGRLGPLRAMMLPPGTWAEWDENRRRVRGSPAEQYKHPCLISDVNFRASLPVLASA
ncbi:MAG: GH3 auxin-responsive promoter family protein [Gemmataceae bacterium]